MSKAKEVGRSKMVDMAMGGIGALVIVGLVVALVTFVFPSKAAAHEVPEQPVTLTSLATQAVGAVEETVEEVAEAYEEADPFIIGSGLLGYECATLPFSDTRYYCSKVVVEVAEVSTD